MRGNNITFISHDELPANPTPGMRVLVYVRQKGDLRMVLVRHSTGEWRLSREVRSDGIMHTLLIEDLGAMRTKDAMRVLDGAWLMFKMEHARETA